jgi:hypothetical protein
MQPTATVAVWLDDDDRGITPRTPNIMHRMQFRQQWKNGTQNGGLELTCRDVQANPGPMDMAVSSLTLSPRSHQTTRRATDLRNLTFCSASSS